MSFDFFYFMNYKVFVKLVIFFVSFQGTRLWHWWKCLHRLLLATFLLKLLKISDSLFQINFNSGLLFGVFLKMKKIYGSKLFLSSFLYFFHFSIMWKCQCFFTFSFILLLKNRVARAELHGEHELTQPCLLRMIPSYDCHYLCEAQCLNGAFYVPQNVYLNKSSRAIYCLKLYLFRIEEYRLYTLRFLSFNSLMNTAFQ